MAKPENWSWAAGDADRFSRLLLESVQQYGVIFMNADGIIRGWNHGAFCVTGFTGDDAIGQHFSLLFTADDRALRIAEHELSTARAVGSAEDERWHLRKDGSRFWSSGLSFPLADARGEIDGFVKIFRDATHLRTRMRYLENVVEDHTAHAKERDTFVGTIAHELRNPLFPLKTALGLMQATGDMKTRAAGPLKMMERQLGFLERLVEDLVDLTRVHTGRLSISYQKTVLQTLIDHAIDASQASANDRGVGLHAVLPPVPIEVVVDVERINQVIVNLVNNAIKFTPRGGDVWVNASVDQTHLLIFVKDNGIGISRDLLPRIFEMFTQAESDSRRGAGLGIGLAVAKEIVALHQGTIEVRSEGHGKGSEFSIRIPQRPQEDAGHESEPEEPYDPKAAR